MRPDAALPTTACQHHDHVWLEVCEGAATVTVEDLAAASRLRAHHAAMVATVEQLAARVAAAEPGPAVVRAAAAMARYWAEELLPHAAAEECTLYAAAESGGARWLVAALLLEHAELRALGRQLGALAAAGGDGPGGGGPRGGGGLGARMPERARGTAVASAAAALFAVHARAENELLLPALAEAGRALAPLLPQMEEEFMRARPAATR